MDGQSCDQLISTMVKAIHAYCSGHIQFVSFVEVIGHVHLNIDRSVRVDYVLSEEVNKGGDGSPSFSSRSYHSHPQTVRSLNDSSPRFSSETDCSQSAVSETNNMNRQEHLLNRPSDGKTFISHNSELECANVSSSSQGLPDVGNHIFADSTDGTGEVCMASDEMRVTISFDHNILANIKQETNPESLSAEEDRPDFQEGCKTLAGMPMNSMQFSSSVPQLSVQPTASFSQDCVHPAVSYLLQHGQSTTVYSESSQPVAASLDSVSESPIPVLQIQDIRSEALSCSQQNFQHAASVNHRKERYHQTNLRINSPSPLAVSQACFQQGRDQHMREDSSSLNGQLTSQEVSSSNSFQPPPPTSMSCQVYAAASGDASAPEDFHRASVLNMSSCQTEDAGESGGNTQFGNLCLDVVTVKEEVMDEVPPSDAQEREDYVLNSGQEMALENFGNMVLETLSHSADGTQLIVVRERLEKHGREQPPFPVMLHASPGLSPSGQSSSSGAFGVGALRVPSVLASDFHAVPCSSSDLPAASCVTAAGNGVIRVTSLVREKSKKRRGGFQPGNQCWKLQERWKTAMQRKWTQQTYQTSASVSSDKEVYMALSSTRKSGADSETAEPSELSVKVVTKNASSTKRLKVNGARSQSRFTATAKTVHPKTPKTVKGKGSPKRLGRPCRITTAESQKYRKKNPDPKDPRTASSGRSRLTPLRGPIHILKKIPWAGQKKQPRKNCIMCKEKGLSLMSCYFCPYCPKQPGYCRIRNCFISHHLQMGLKHLVPPARRKSKVSA